MAIEELKSKISIILDECEGEDWIWNGKDEIKVTHFNKEKAAQKIAELVSKMLSETSMPILS